MSTKVLFLTALIEALLGGIRFISQFLKAKSRQRKTDLSREWLELGYEFYDWSKHNRTEVVAFKPRKWSDPVDYSYDEDGHEIDKGVETPPKTSDTSGRGEK